MCECLKETAARLREKIGAGDLSELSPKNGSKLLFLMENNWVLIFRTGKTRLNIPFAATWKLPPDKAGKVKNKDTTINVLASHCPFCGEAVETGDEPEQQKGAL